MKEAAIAVSLILLVLNFFLGVITACNLSIDRSRVANQECEYHSISDLAPGRVAACELMRKRW